MATPSPPRLSVAELRARLNRAVAIARGMGFVGQIEYRHAYSRSGGAQYAQARTPEEDMLIVFAEAFDRDADPDDFSLEAMLAHERGHQILARHPRIAKMVAGRPLTVEEILASIIGALLCHSGTDQEVLMRKATYELVIRGVTPEAAAKQVQDLRDQLETLL